ncbi:MAG TPA: ATP synthase F0 subunit B [Polyangiaceae bacterium]|jgi:F-type H+-transporting ATPase subunit b
MHVSLWNVALQTINFVVLAWLLQRFLFKPVRAALTKRQEAIESTLREAESKKADAVRTIEEYRAKSEGITGEAERAREAALATVEKDAQRLRDEAVRQAQAELERAKGEVQRERVEALHALESRAAELATVIARRLLTDAIPDSDSPFLWRVTASIDSLDPARRAGLGRQVAAGSVEMTSARPLEAPTRARFEGWLTALAGTPVSTSYVLDQSLIAGVEVRLATDVWRSNWRASLEHIRTDLEAHATAA